MKAKEFDQKFDDGEDITEMLDLSQAKRPLCTQKEKIVSIYLPVQVVMRIKQEASRLGVEPIIIIQSWLAEDFAINNPRKQSISDRTRRDRRISDRTRRDRRISNRTRRVRLQIKLSVPMMERINQEASRLGVRPGEIIQNRLKHLSINNPRAQSRNPR